MVAPDAVFPLKFISDYYRSLSGTNAAQIPHATQGDIRPHSHRTCQAPVGLILKYRAFPPNTSSLIFNAVRNVCEDGAASTLSFD
jgi:hypothetical protein